ncbi:MAG: RdgB/HAM1 family non-canonical purine NTP pyrophosphatase [Spirochaetales bacterium]|nr:RdgB/HAM1 family non-canonical purine NTP pyrophosphatase [Spirochaetales bacterium]
MEVVLATGNAHKAKELEKILAPHRVLTPADLGLDFDCEETGATYLDNALLKARTLAELTDKPVIADDSGLSLPALGGAPGIYSARYGSEEAGRMLEAPERNDFLLKNLQGIEDRSAFFVCSMVLILSEYRVYAVQETLDGEITSDQSGTGGFGYDPVFYLPEREMTVADLSEEEKNLISHRGKAGAKIKLILDSLAP